MRLAITTTEPGTKLRLHTEETETSAAPDGLILGSQEITEYPGCTQYRTQVIQTINGKPFNIIDTIHVTVTPDARGTRVYSKAFINLPDVPNMHSVLDNETSPDDTVRQHTEQIRKNMERGISQL